MSTALKILRDKDGNLADWVKFLGGMITSSVIWYATTFAKVSALEETMTTFTEQRVESRLVQLEAKSQVRDEQINTLKLDIGEIKGDVKKLLSRGK